MRRKNERFHSLWHQTASIPPRDSLEKDRETDVAVIGAGLAGILIADQLRRRGIHALVLEANRIGSGQTGQTTAKITSQHAMIYDALIRTLGEEKARQYAQANESAIRAYRERICEDDIDCGFREQSAYLYTQVNPDPLRQEADAARSLGIDASFTTKTGLPFPVAGAVRFDHQAQFHPLRFVRALCRGLEIFEHTRALSVEDDQILTPRGVVRAKSIVFATHFPFVNAPGFYFMRMHQERSYVLALKSSWLPDGMYDGVDNDGLSFREAEGLLLLGGGAHRTGENSAGGRYDALRENARTLLPGSQEQCCWSAQDCVTLDGVPYIGPFSRAAPNWYVATGFAKWGMSTSMAAAQIVSGMIAGETPVYADVFSPSRFALSASAKGLATETVQSFKGLTRGVLNLPRATLESLPCGHGGIVEIDGEKTGVYKDERGRCHIVKPRCPHLGCQLEWNPDERSWDCPCHGSRFRFDGSVIDNPAQEDLIHESIIP